MERPEGQFGIRVHGDALLSGVKVSKRAVFVDVDLDWFGLATRVLGRCDTHVPIDLCGIRPELIFDVGTT